MESKEKPVLGDKSVYPSDEVLYSLTGENLRIWQKVIDYTTGNYENITSEWRYYNDGKQWLFKIQFKKKTIFWSGVHAESFRITFYFGNKAEAILEGSDLPVIIKEQFRTAKTFGNMRPVTFSISPDTDLESIFKLIDLKNSLK